MLNLDIIFLVLVIVLILIAFLPAEDFKSKEEKKTKKALSLYGKAEGHFYDKNVRDAVATAGENSGNERGANNATLAFIVGDLYRYNIPGDYRTNEAIAERFYNQALINIETNPEINENILDPAFILDRVENFYIRRARRHGFPNEERIREPINQIRNNVVLARIEKTANTTKKERRENFYENRGITRDPQNVHGHQANVDSRKIIDRLRDLAARGEKRLKTPMETDAAIREDIEKNSRKIFADLKGGEMRTRTSKTIRVLNRVSQNAMYLPGGEKEGKILSLVWNRIENTNNKTRRREMKKALYNALADAASNRGVVCQTGRVARMTNAFAAIDPDETVGGGVRTEEVIRNEALHKTNALVKKMVSQEDKEMQDIYNGVIDIDINHEKDTPDEIKQKEAHEKRLKDFVGKARTQIDKTLREDYKDVDKNQLDNVIREAQMGVDI